MSAASAPFGFRPSYHISGQDRARKYSITGAYGTAIYKFMPVILNTNGTVVAGTAAADLFGVFAGCEFIDSTGKPTVSNFWPAGQTVQASTVPVAWVFDDVDTVYDVQASATVAATAIGDQADTINPGTGSTSTGLSTAGLNATLVGAGAQGQWRIVGLAGFQDNAWGDAFPILQVQLARSQMITSKVAI